MLAAAAALVEAFGAHDRERYFACFAPEATLVFHSTPQLLSSRAAYRELWLQWESEGLHVLSCRSLEPRVDIVGPGTAVFTHRVRTLLHGEVDELRERETIVFRHEPDGRWRAVHEHLSIDPDDQAAP